MAPGFAVELSDLRGWGTQVGRASDDMDAAHGYGTTHVTDGDFGRILEMITGDYDAALAAFHDILSADNVGLGEGSEALDSVVALYKGADEEAGSDFAELDEGKSGSVTDDGEAAAFTDKAAAADELSPPDSSGVELPEVDFGFIWNKVSDLVEWVSGWDPREEITKWIAGDLGKASMQASAWDATAGCTEAVGGNLRAGNEAIGHTWSGEAADAAAAHFGEWLPALSDQSAGMRKMAEYLRDAIDQAVQMAQVVVDIVKTVISLLSAAISNAAIPFYGQWKLIKSVKEGAQMLWGAIKVIKVFWNALKMIIDGIKMVIMEFSRESLPPAPAAVPQ